MSRVQAAILLRRLFLFLHIHAAVSLSQQLLGIVAVNRRYRHADAQGKNFFTAHVKARLPRQRTNLLNLLSRGVGLQARGDHHKFVSTHARDVVVLSAAIFQRLCEQAQHAIALQVPEAVVNLLEAVHVADHHGERSLIALAAG